MSATTAMTLMTELKVGCSYMRIPWPVPPTLSSLVESIRYSQRELPPSLERVFPVGYGMHLHINLQDDELYTYGPGGRTATRFSGSALEGPHSQYTIIDTQLQRCAISVAFRIGSSQPLFGMPATEARDRIIELEDLWGRDGRLLRERLLEANTPAERLRIVEQVLLGRLSATDAPDLAIESAARLLQRGVSVADVAESLGWLPTKLRRRFREQIGLSPKRYARVQRLQRLVAAVHQNGSVDWAEEAVTYGYFDQAHLVHDFRELTGITPTVYLANQTAQRNHVVEGLPGQRESIFTIRRDHTDVPSPQVTVDMKGVSGNEER